MSSNSTNEERKNDERSYGYTNGKTECFVVLAIETKQEIMVYDTLECFIDNFPLAERQCIHEVQQELDNSGCFQFSDFDSPMTYLLRKMLEY